jgi:hypothetical protein
VSQTKQVNEEKKIDKRKYHLNPRENYKFSAWFLRIMMLMGKNDNCNLLREAAV